MSSNPMARAVRIDSMVVATLEPVLRSHLQGRAAQDLPVYRAVAMDNDALDAFGQELANGLRQRLGEQRWSVEVTPSKARMGGGSQPQAELPSRCLRLRLDGVASHDLERRLRQGQTPLIGRSRGDHISLDLRSLLAGSAPEDLLEELAQALLDASD
jgi:L-seryl-tRNA(Ser) seleniumtransferase